MLVLTLSRVIKLAYRSLESSIFTDRIFSAIEPVFSSLSKLTAAQSIHLSPSAFVSITLKPVVHTKRQTPQDSTNAKASKDLHFLAGSTSLELDRNLYNFGFVINNSPGILTQAEAGAEFD